MASFLDMLPEDVDWPNGNLPGVSTNSAYFRSASGYARCALNAPLHGAIVSTPIVGGPLTDFWLSFRSYNSAGFGGPGIGPYLSTSGKGIVIGQSDGEYLQLLAWDGSALSVLATELAPTFAALTLHHVTMHVTSWGATATVDLYLDGGLTPRISYTGNLTFGSTTANIDSLIGLGGNFTSLWCSEQVVSDEDTRLGSVSTGPPNGAGGTDDWTGAYTDVNEITLDTGTAVYVNTAAKDEQFATGGLPSGLWAIKGKKISATCCKTSTSTPDHVALGVFEGGTVSAGTPQAMVTAWGTYNRVMILNPRTSAAWLQAQTTQINLRSS